MIFRNVRMRLGMHCATWKASLIKYLINLAQSTGSGPIGLTWVKEDS